MSKFTFGILVMITMSMIIGTSMTHVYAEGNKPTTTEALFIIDRVDHNICSIDLVQTKQVVKISITTWPNDNNYRYSEIITREFFNMDNESVGTAHSKNTIHGEFDGTGAATAHFTSTVKCDNGQSEKHGYVVVINKNGSTTHGLR